MSSLTINQHYNFIVYANSILGVSYQDARLMSILDYQTALKFDNVQLLHRQVFPYLPDGTIEDLTSYTYYLFKSGSKTFVLADVWIVSNSIEISSGTSYSLKLLNVSTGELSIIRDQLRLLGVTFTIT